MALAKNIVVSCSDKILNFDTMAVVAWIMTRGTDWMNQIGVVSSDIDESTNISRLHNYRQSILGQADSSYSVGLTVPLWIRVLFDGLEQLRRKQVRLLDFHILLICTTVHLV